jgi:CBS domain-containing protein
MIYKIDNNDGYDKILKKFFIFPIFYGGNKTMLRVRDLLQSKTKETWSISPGSSVFEALKIMDEKEIGALIVKDKKDKVIGIITERDYARKVTLQGKTSRDASVSEIMTPLERLYKVNPDTSVEDCMVLITGKRIRHLPVFDGDNYVGLVSIGDVMKSIISEKDALIEHLSNYIGGKF